MTCEHKTGDGKCGKGVFLLDQPVPIYVCNRCSRYEGPVRGLGDMVARVTKAIGIAPCGGCQKRRELLNKVSFGVETPASAAP